MGISDDKYNDRIKTYAPWPVVSPDNSLPATVFQTRPAQLTFHPNPISIDRLLQKIHSLHSLNSLAGILGLLPRLIPFFILVWVTWQARQNTADAVIHDFLVRGAGVEFVGRVTQADARVAAWVVEDGLFQGQPLKVRELVD